MKGKKIPVSEETKKALEKKHKLNAEMKRLHPDWLDMDSAGFHDDLLEVEDDLMEEMERERIARRKKK